MLQEVEKKYSSRGVVLLAINIDEPEARSRIPAFLRQHDLDCRVLLAGPEGLPGYDFNAASSLFLIDRKGLLAGVPGDFYFRLREELQRRLPDLVEGKATPGPILWTLETAPPGLGELWHKATPRNVLAMSVAPASAGHPAEIGVMDASHLRRYSASGEIISEGELEAKDGHLLRGVDLDGDGTQEWIVAGDRGFTVLNGEGEGYWEYSARAEPLEIVGFPDLDGDGLREILIREGDALTALRNVPRVFWRNESLGKTKSVILGPREVLEVHSGPGIQTLDGRGRPQGSPRRVPVQAIYRGRWDLGSGQGFDVFEGPYEGPVDVQHDLNGDGVKDILVAGRGGLGVYDRQGSPLLLMKLSDNQGPVMAALADLDGRPGDELVIYIPQYGLVALGRKPSPEKNPTPETSKR